jgi:hypothetical protein
MPYLSHSQVNRYLHCPEQYRLYYVEHLRRRIPAANLVFGQIVHQALAAFFLRQRDPVQVFQDLWQELRTIDLDYSPKDSWDLALATGRTLLERFVRDEAPRVRNIEAVEQKFELEITSLDLPFVGIIDLVAQVDDRRSVVDFKTAGSGYQPHEVVLSDQLTAYQLAEPTAEQTGLYDLLIFDTAPTGHTLQMLRTPEAMSSWLRALATSRREMLSSDRRDTDEIVNTLEERIARLQQFRARVTSGATTAFVLVLIPERLPIDETARAAEQLADGGIRVGSVIVNRVIPESAAGEFIEARRRQERVHLAEIERVFAGYYRSYLPQHATDIHGLADLDAIARALFATTR